MLDNLREKSLALPQKPGVYIMMDASGDVIYVGKAKSLKNRVSSYFSGAHDTKTTQLVSKVDNFNVILTGSEFEALVLENSLIKRHMPKYNILLKDDKGYPFVRLDIKSEYPKFTISSVTANDGNLYFGPYGGRGATMDALSAISKALKLPVCSRVFPRDIGKSRPCLNYHMGNCRAYCKNDTPRSEYTRAIEQAVMILEGKTGELIARLREEMEDAAVKLLFERAAELRDTINAITLLEKKQNVVSGAMADTDVIGFYRGSAKSSFVVLHFIGGKLLDKDYELLESPIENDGEAVSGLVRQYYENRCAYPKNIYLPCETEDIQDLERMFYDNAGKRIYIQAPKRGEKRELIKKAELNAKEEAERASTNEEKVLKTLEWLQKALNMNEPPNRIEAFDISNTGSSDIVASMTVFKLGRPLKKDYKRFKIKSLEGQNDLGSMREVLTRRFKRYKDGDEGFSDRPDLLLIDGGSTHAALAEKVLSELGLDIPIFGMVKDERHRTRALVSSQGDEIGIGAVTSVFALIGRIQEETHRFAIEYHRKLRSKNSYGSSLDKIKGVGANRRNTLLKHFKSIKNIAGATLEELSGVVPKNTAKAVYEHFHGGNEENTK